MTSTANSICRMATICRGTLVTVVLVGLTGAITASCKPKNAKMKDAATRDSFKTGLFMPRTKSQFALAGKQSPISVTNFLAEARRLSGDQSMRVLFDEKITYATTVNGKGEQLLLVISKEALPLPVASIEAGKLYSWHQSVVVDRQRQEIGVNELFVKAPHGKSPASPAIEQMYVRRHAQNDMGQREAVLVPWLSHVRSETSEVLTFQVGNSVLEAKYGHALLEFRQPSSKPIWFVIGRYQDKDVRGGTVFWRTSESEYFSLTKGSSTVTKWRKQDDDSIDRVGIVALSGVQVPTVAQSFLDKLPSEADKNHPLNIPVSGFDSWSGDQTVFQLDRNSMTIVDDAATTKLGLDGSVADEVLTEEDYRYPKSGALGLGIFWDSNKPVETWAKTGQGNMQSAAYTDQNGDRRAGTVLSSRNVFVPGGYFSSGSYEQRYFIHNATNNTVSEVAADGRVVRYDMPVNEFVNRQQTNINIDRMQREGGSDGRAIAQSNQLAGRTSRQLQISESYMAGGSVGEMAKGVATNLAIGQVREQVDGVLKDDAKALARVLGDQAQNAVLGKTHGYQDVGTTFLRSADKTAVDQLAKVASDSVAVGVWKDSDLSATASKRVGAYAGGGVKAAGDMYFKYQDLKAQGIFDPTDPDASFNASVGGARVAGAGVSNVAGFIAAGDPLEKSPGTAAVGRLVKDSTGIMFDEAAALSHGIQANTIERERTQVLENVGQRMRDANAAGTALNSLETLERVQGGVMNGTPSQQ
jgi:hypothetical protein